MKNSVKKRSVHKCKTTGKTLPEIQKIDLYYDTNCQKKFDQFRKVIEEKLANNNCSFMKVEDWLSFHINTHKQIISYEKALRKNELLQAKLSQMQFEISILKLSVADNCNQNVFYS